MRILVTFPTSPSHPYIHKRIGMIIWRLSKEKRYDIHPIWPTHNPFENNLNKIVQDFIKGDYMFWLSIDADNPPIRNPLDLVEYNRDIIGLPTPVWNYTGKPGERPIYWNAYDYIPEKDAYKEHEQKKGLQPVDAIGTGCFLISKRVLLDKNMKASFLRQYDDNGIVYKGNDISFSEKAKKAGFEIFAHYDYPCMHFVELELNEVIAAFKGLCRDNK